MDRDGPPNRAPGLPITAQSLFLADEHFR
jgi:hypothetical protein